jgi:hypothetical protein
LIDVVTLAGQQQIQDGSQCDVFLHEEDAPGAGEFEHNQVGWPADSVFIYG